MSPEEGIRRTLALYCHRIDEHDSAGYVSLFSRNTRLYTALAVREGHPGIWDHINDVYSRWEPGLLTKHLLGAGEINVHGDTADAATDVVVWHCMPEGGWVLRQTARYLDKFVLEDGEWRILDRRIEGDTYAREQSS
jgi:hypothetical protein